MENASKALLMAAGVLMTVLVLTLGLYLYASFSDSSQKMQDRINEANLDEFNNKFLAYTSSECTIYDILNLVNLADDNNERYNATDGDGYYIGIYIGSSSMNNLITNKVIQNDLSTLGTSTTSQYAYLATDAFGNSNLKLKKYECISIEYNDLTSRVSKMVFKVKP